MLLVLRERKAKSIAGEIPGDKYTYKIIDHSIKKKRKDKEEPPDPDFNIRLTTYKSLKQFTYFRNQNDFNFGEDS
jgi:hypothetical protein